MEKEERYINVWLSLLHPLLGSWPTPRHVPWLWIKLVTLWFAGRYSVHWGILGLDLGVLPPTLWWASLLRLQVHYHGKPISVNVCINNCTSTVNKKKKNQDFRWAAFPILLHLVPNPQVFFQNSAPLIQICIQLGFPANAGVLKFTCLCPWAHHSASCIVYKVISEGSELGTRGWLVNYSHVTFLPVQLTRSQMLSCIH